MADTQLPDEAKVLSDEEIGTIQSHTKTGHYPDLDTIDALCATVRALRQWKKEALPLLTRYDNLAETFGGKLGSSKVENLERGVTVLREQLAQAQHEAEWQKSTIEQLTVGVTGCAERLAQVEQERDQLKEDLRILTKGRFIQS